MNKRDRERLAARLEPVRPAEIETAMNALGMNMNQLATALGVNRATVYQWISGQRSPRPHHLEQLATLLRRAQ